MNKTKRNNGRENSHVLACPHCGAGTDEVTVGLFWDFNDHCWRCVTCGFRVYEHAARPRTQAEIVAEKLWDGVLYALDAEDGDPALLRSVPEVGTDSEMISLA